MQSNCNEIMESSWASSHIDGIKNYSQSSLVFLNNKNLNATETLKDSANSFENPNVKKSRKYIPKENLTRKRITNQSEWIVNKKKLLILEIVILTRKV